MNARPRALGANWEQPEKEKAPVQTEAEGKTYMNDTTQSIQTTAAVSAPLIPATVPQELRDLPGWLIWRYEQIEGEPKPRKVPHWANGGKRWGAQGGAEDRANLVTFDTARAAAARRGFDGVGFATLPEFGIVALDFDNCMADGGVHPEVEALVAGTYAEHSPSGNGVRAFMRGQLGNRKSSGQPYGFETFSTKGFVTVTGRCLDVCELLGNENTIADVTQEIRELCGQRFGARALTDGDAQSTGHKTPVGLTAEQISEALNVLDADSDHNTWLKVGMALHHETGGEGFALWNEWSERGSKYPGEEALQKRWDSFGQSDGDLVTAHTLLNLAEGAQPGLRAEIEDVASDFDVIQVATTEAERAPLPAFKRTRNGQIEATKENVTLALARADLCGFQLRHDVFRDEIMLAPPGTDQWRTFRDTDYTELCMRLERGDTGFKDIPKERIRDAVAYVAELHTFDSAQRWLAMQQWDGVPRIERFLVDYFGAEDTPYTQAVGAYFWTALAGRVLQPGIKADMVPVAVGAQGSMKSSTVAAIVPAPDYFLELDLGSKDEDLARLMRGKLVIELGELKGLRAREHEHLKAFITRTHESWVPKFKEMPVTYARRGVFFGTTNKDEFLADDTGHRRWLPFKAGVCDPNKAARDRGQLWAEARDLFTRDGVQWQQAEELARAEHERYVVRDAWEEVIEQWLATPDDLSGSAPGDQPFTAVDALRHGLGMDARNITQSAKDRMARVLKELGYTQTRAYIDGKRARAYVRIG